MTISDGGHVLNKYQDIVLDDTHEGRQNLARMIEELLPGKEGKDMAHLVRTDIGYWKMQLAMMIKLVKEHGLRMQ